MRNKEFLLFFLLIFLCLKAFPATFVVTSNADSGPGTLRDALTQAAANGSAVQDSILFNLPDTSVTGRTITLLSQLPFVSSNLVIDGSTQSGSTFLKSDARIAITVNRYTYIDGGGIGAFTLQNVQNVEIFGLSFEGFNELQNPYGSINPFSTGIYITSSQNIIIGSPGKGNLFKDNNYEINASSVSFINDTTQSNFLFQSNYFGFNDPNQSFVPLGVTISGNNVTFGGNNLNESNHFAVPLATGGDSIKIVHNYFGLDINGNPVGNIFPNIECDNSSNVEISHNISFILKLSMTSTKNFNIYANNDINTNSSIAAGGLGMQNCSNGVIGSADESLKNILRTNTGETGDQITSTIVNGSSNNIQLLKNEIICSRNAYYISLQAGDNILIPKIQVLVNNSNEYSGTASPNANIYIYKDTTDCPVCSPVKFDTIVTADSNGLWKITGNFAGTKWVSNALLSKNSSEFTQPLFSYLDDYFSQVEPSCGNNNGSIAITKDYQNILTFQWYNSNNEMIGTGAVLNNVGPGTYYVKGYNGLCFARSIDFILYDVTPSIISNNVKITSPSCGSGGSVTGLLINANSNDPLTFTWTDSNDKIVGNTLDINNLALGVYTFTLTDTVTKCSLTYGPITLQNVTGPNINQSHALIQPTNCGQSSGSITNLTITGSGTLSYAWLNTQQQTVGTDSVLTNQPAGTYTLKVTDASQCGPVYSSAINIPQTNGITLDTASVKIAIASCSNNNGSITGITATGATQYQWLNANNTAVATTPDLVNAAPGSYTLTASNSFGCSETTKAYTIGQQTPIVFPLYNNAIYFSCSGKSTGGVSVSADSLVKAERWVDSAGVTVGSGPMLVNVAAGTYHLYLTDKNGCESLYNSYNVPAIPQLTITEGSEQIINDQCDLKNGSVTNITVTGGTPPYAYTWTDVNSNTVAKLPNLSGVGAGAYTLNVADATTCGAVTATYTVQEQNEIIPAPVVNNLQLCGPGNVLLRVNNPLPDFSYRLYNSETSATPMAEATSGTFQVTVNTNSAYYVSQLNGDCESSRTPVQVSIGLTAVDIANTFTPNGDGINDLWNIKGITSYPNAIIQVFTRNGQKVFDSKGYPTPFDGTFNGKPLPQGVYYYIIDLKASCSLISGSLTLLR